MRRAVREEGEGREWSIWRRSSGGREERGDLEGVSAGVRGMVEKNVDADVGGRGGSRKMGLTKGRGSGVLVLEGQ